MTVEIKRARLALPNRLLNCAACRFGVSHTCGRIDSGNATSSSNRFMRSTLAWLIRTRSCRVSDWAVCMRSRWRRSASAGAAAGA